MIVKFQDMEVVKVTGEVVISQKQWRLTGETGFICGWTDPFDDGHRDYAVYFNAFGEAIGLPEWNLESLGRIADRDELVPRGRAKQGRKVDILNHPSSQENLAASKLARRE